MNNMHTTPSGQIIQGKKTEDAGLRNKKNLSQVYDVNTNYEDPKLAPKRNLREICSGHREERELN